MSSSFPPLSLSLSLSPSLSSPTSPDHFTSLKLQHTEALQKVQEQNVLITQLEADLSLVHPYLPVRGEGEGQDATPSSADILSEAIKDISGRSERKSVGEMTGADSLLPIVSSQRERFKQRNIELEAVSLDILLYDSVYHTISQYILVYLCISCYLCSCQYTSVYLAYHSSISLNILLYLSTCQYTSVHVYRSVYFWYICVHAGVPPAEADHFSAPA